MNREYFSQSTKRILVHMRAYNYKLCRKGLLQRAENMNVTIGEFKNEENSVFNDIFNTMGKNYPLINLKESKMKIMKNEIKSLDVAIKALGITIMNMKNDIKSRISDKIYDMWLNRVNDISKRFKKLYSDSNNDLYNHFYKDASTQNAAWSYVIENSEWIENNICVMYKENECTSCMKKGDTKVKDPCYDENNSNKIRKDEKCDESVNEKKSVYKCASNSKNGKITNDISSHVEGFEEGDLTNLFSTEIKKSNNKRSITNEETNLGNTNKKLKKNLKDCGGVNESKKMEIAKDKYEELSDDDESSIMNAILIRDHEGDEVGNLELNEFSEYLEKFIE